MLERTGSTGIAGQISNVAYDFKLYREWCEPCSNRAKKCYAEKLVETDGLNDPYILLDTQLGYCNSYFWTVRARFQYGEMTRVTEWAGNYDFNNKWFDQGDIYHLFEDGSPAPVYRRLGKPLPKPLLMILFTPKEPWSEVCTIQSTIDYPELFKNYYVFPGSDKIGVTGKRVQQTHASLGHLIQLDYLEFQHCMHHDKELCTDPEEMDKSRIRFTKCIKHNILESLPGAVLLDGRILPGWPPVSNNTHTGVSDYIISMRVKVLLDNDINNPMPGSCVTVGPQFDIHKPASAVVHAEILRTSDQERVGVLEANSFALNKHVIAFPLPLVIPVDLSALTLSDRACAAFGKSIGSFLAGKGNDYIQAR